MINKRGISTLVATVLLEPQFYDEWQVSDDRIEIMMKKHDGKIYLFTASAYYGDIHDVIITLPGYKLKKVTALNDTANGDTSNPIPKRDIAINSDKQSFTDSFIGDDASSPAGVATPGYAVHVYGIEYEQI